MFLFSEANNYNVQCLAAAARRTNERPGQRGATRRPECQILREDVARTRAVTVL